MKEKQRIFSPPNGSYFLFGPRGTGKSTWLKKRYGEAFYIDLLLPDVFRSYSVHPEVLKKQISANQDVSVVLIDEVQKIPELLAVVHSIIEEHRDIQFIMTGSSSRKLKRAGVDLLAGRAIKRAMHPFMAVELEEQFDLGKALQLGMLPVVWGSKDPTEVLEAYVSLYIQEEVQFERVVKDFSSFSRFLSIIAYSHASSLNVSNISNDCEVKRHLVEDYIEILQDLLLSYQLPVFTKRAQRELVAHPKFYLFDAGVFRALRAVSLLDIQPEIDGLALEGLILQHLKAWCDYSKRKYQIAYWRTKAGLEVDFIVYGEGCFWAIEVKNSSRISSKDVRGLLHFQEDYPECTPLLLYRGDLPLIEKNITCISCAAFLQQLTPNEPLWRHKST
jgi:predicted AAA+ superfamily ATPase